MSENNTQERPMLFSGPLVRAILDGSKTQTRRPVKSSPGLPPGVSGEYVAWERGEGADGAGWYNDKGKKIPEPFGKPGDRLWVREAWSVEAVHNASAPIDIETTAVDYLCDDECDRMHKGFRGKGRPSIHMPRWASRIDLEVTGVRVERLQDASKGDLVHEGWPEADEVALAYASVCKTMHENIDDGVVEWFADTWDAIYAKQGLGWDENPWVWVVEFERIES